MIALDRDPTNPFEEGQWTKREPGEPNEDGLGWVSYELSRVRLSSLPQRIACYQCGFSQKMQQRTSAASIGTPET